ncbi:MAG TPA: hypothetical protein VN700_08970 [Vicinamibacterales bacterium]|nr:hypothetical protein [Vicinamibacterales bacterium]
MMVENRLERIRLLSERFQELQGLRVAVAGVSLAAAMGVYLMVAPVPTNNGALAALLLALAPMVPGVWYANRYYSATFGRQVSNPVARKNKATLVFLLVYFGSGWILNTTFPAIPSGAPTVATVALVSLWVAVRDWPWRGYYVGAPVAVALTFASTASAGGTLDPGKTLAFLFLATGVSLVPIGVLDHLLLVRLLKESRESLARRVN